MEVEQHRLQTLGFFGTIKQSLKITFSFQKIFNYISLTLILPLSIIYLAQIQFTDLISTKIDPNNTNTNTNQSSYLHRSIYLWIFDFVYFIFFLTLYLLSTAAVVYTIACIFTATQFTFNKVIKVIPTLWKRLSVTFFWFFLFICVYNLVGTGIVAVLIAFVGGSVAGVVVIVVVLIVLIVGVVYASLVWQLASVVSVLEEEYGLKALKKSRKLLKGKIWISVCLFILFCLLFGGIEVAFERLVVAKWSRNLGMAIPIGILCVVAMCLVILYGLVVQTVLYFVCKSYHNEIIDKPMLSDQLKEYVGDYVRLNRSKDVQLQQQSAV